MPEYELISPFPEEDLPALWVWFQPYKYKTEYAEMSERQFVEAKRVQEGITWAVRREGELGGYLEYEPEGEYVGFMSLLCKTQFFRFFRQQTIIPALREAITSVFNDPVLPRIVLFRPISSNQGMIRLLRSIGAKEAGWMEANGIPERRVMAIGSGDWKAQRGYDDQTLQIRYDE